MFKYVTAVILAFPTLQLEITLFVMFRVLQHCKYLITSFLMKAVNENSWICVV